MPVEVFTFGPYVFDCRQGSLLRNGSPVAIGAKGRALLRALLEADGEVVTKSVLMDAAWPNTIVEESNLTVQVAALRKVLDETADGEAWIATEPRVGYRLIRSLPARRGDRGAVADEPTRGAVADEPTPRATGSKPSIAVLPFTNMSSDPDQEHLGDGLAEDLITELSKVPDLLVIARHSSFAYKSKPTDVRSIASDLDVRYVVEGSVRRAAERVRICAQIVDAIDNTHLWAERFDRNLVDIFALQDEIVGRIVSGLSGLLPSRPNPARQGPVNIEARWESSRRPLAWRFSRSACRFLSTGPQSNHSAPQRIAGVSSTRMRRPVS
jgi:TolB-like protein